MKLVKATFTSKPMPSNNMHFSCTAERKASTSKNCAWSHVKVAK